jgi:hypothetical protein
MRFISRSALLALVAVFSMSVVAATVAQAEGGPVWITHDGVLPKKLVSAGSTAFGLEIPAVSITCSKETNKGEITGTNPGTGKDTLTFSGCVVPGSLTACVATGVAKAGEKGTAGVIVLGGKTVLMYAKQGSNSTEADEAFFPEAANNVFAEITLKAEPGGSCGLLEGKTFLVKAKGTEVNEPAVDRKCGLLAEVGKSNGGSPPVFARTASGVLAEAGALGFPGAITSAVVWQEKAKTFESVNCALEMWGSSADVIGTAVVNTGPAEPFGWEM